MQLFEPTVRLSLVGEELRRHRESAGLVIAEAARKIGVTPSTLSRMETGKLPQKCDQVAGLLAVYGVVGADRRELLELTRSGDKPGLWQRSSSSMAQRVATLKLLESRAIGLINFENGVVPGLLQTVPYARAVISSFGLVRDEDLIGERVADRIHRQAVLRKAGAPHFQAIIAEGALRNVIGDRAVMRDQLTYLIEAAQNRNISVRVIPTSATNHPGFEGPFMRLQFAGRHGVVMLENRTTNLFLEDDEDLMTYNHVLVELLSVALNEADSLALVARLVATLE
jgi:transcriptional regulator with XRE-family HTH domain